MPERELIDRVRKALSDRYTVITSIGRGGNACIFGAYDQAGQRVAVKVLHPELAVSVAADRFVREMRYAAQLDHPHIARLLDSGETEYLLWFVMPFVDGESLRQTLRRERRLAIDRAARIACEVLDALEYATGVGSPIGTSNPTTSSSRPREPCSSTSASPAPSRAPARIASPAAASSSARRST
jgi:serine/threonine-protein kinase